MQPYLIVIIVVASLLVVLFALAALCEGFAFGKRCDKNPNLKYFTAEDFNLSAEPVALSNGLKGYMYSSAKKRDDGKIIIFCHGMGPGHIAYTTEIAYFCNLGYPVLAIDSRGCNLSEGKSIKGMYSGVNSVLSAIDYVNKSQAAAAGGEAATDKAYASPKIYLVGHSWGAYSALCASAKEKVSGVVAISAPDTPSKTVLNGAAAVISRPFAAILYPFWWIINLLKFGFKGNSGAARCAKKNSILTLLIQGDSDGVVTKSNSAFYKSKGRNIVKLSVHGRAHNPYNTPNAEKLLAELSAKLRRGETDFTDFDFTAATEEDEEVMAEIARFIENN